MNRKFRRSFTVMIASAAWIGGATQLAVAAPSKITSIDFKAGDKSQIEIRADGPVTYEKQENAPDSQVVIELKNAQLTKGATRKLDTSSFNSPVSLISPYQLTDQPDSARIVIQMRQMTGAEVTQEGNLIRVTIPNSSQNSGAATKANAESPATPAAPGTNDAPPEAATAKNDAQAPAAAAAPAPAPAPEKSSTDPSLEGFVESTQTRRFVGKPITLQVRDADLVDIFRLIGDASGFNILISDEVRGKVTLSLVDVPWDQVLDVILRSHRLAAERSNNILRITTLASLTTEKQQELQAKQASLASTPRVTKVFPVSFASLSDLKKMITQFIGGATQQSQPGVPASIVESDDRTNSLIVRDTPENVEKIRKIVETLDTQTPQVLIEAQIVEATETFGRNISGQFGISGKSVSIGVNGGAVNPTSLVSGPSFGIGGSEQVSLLGRMPQLNALLTLQENEEQAKVIARPKGIVLNKKTVNVTAGQPVLVPTSGTAAGVGQVNGLQQQVANTTLTVTPTVTNDGSVNLEITATRDGITSAGVAPRNIKTEVLVDSGSTLVIGGLFSTTENKSSSGIPLLRKIPLIGSLFGSDSHSTNRSEILFFITPRILNPKEAIQGPS